MKAHLFCDRGRYRWSGHNARGDPHDGAGERRAAETAPRPFDLIVDVGREFILTSENKLYITGPGPHQFSEWTIEEFILAAQQGWFGFTILEG